VAFPPTGAAAGPRVVVVGDVMTDVVAMAAGPLSHHSDTPASVTLQGGGSAANVAAWLATLGVPTAFLGRVGDDDLGRRAAGELSAYGVDARLGVDPHRSTGTCVVLVEPGGERTMLPDAGANLGLTVTDLPMAVFRPGAHLHLSGYTLLRAGSRPAALTALRRAREARMTVSVDASSAAPLQAVGAAAFLEWTEGVDVCLANIDEARVLSGRSDPRAAAEVLSERYREVVVKLGPRGALWHGGFVGASAPGERVDEVVDTTGAGDAFAAGFLAEWLLHPEPESALTAGNRLAARAVVQVGARPLLG
jgi:sugar/nucleoside kinase (ribokinase family)